MKKNLFLLAILAFAMVSCGNKTQAESQSTTTTGEASIVAVADTSLINVYYFHGKQRCKTCMAIETVAKNAVETNYKDNPNVKFVEVNIDEAQNKGLTEKYEVSFSSLIIAKGENQINLTEQAFANALNSPDVLVGLVKDEVTKRLQ